MTRTINTCNVEAQTDINKLNRHLKQELMNLLVYWPMGCKRWFEYSKIDETMQSNEMESLKLWKRIKLMTRFRTMVILMYSLHLMLRNCSLWGLMWRIIPGSRLHCLLRKILKYSFLVIFSIYSFERLNECLW